MRLRDGGGSKVFLHNLCHLFARVFYGACHDIIRVADVLGHSSVDTSRIYTVSSGREHSMLVEKTGLVWWGGIHGTGAAHTPHKRNAT